MKIVVDIPEDVYTRLFDPGIAADDVCEIARALRFGKPLPKGHGDLIDKNDLLLTMAHLIDRMFVCDVPTIIGADMRGEEE